MTESTAIEQAQNEIDELRQQLTAEARSYRLQLFRIKGALLAWRDNEVPAAGVHRLLEEIEEVIPQTKEQVTK